MAIKVNKKTTKVNGKVYTLYPMTGTEAINYAYDVISAVSPALGQALNGAAPKVKGDALNDIMNKDKKMLDKNLESMISLISGIDFKGVLNSFFYSCPKDKFIAIWEATKPYIKEGEGKEPNWELDFSGDALSQIKLLMAYIKAYITPFLSDSMNIVETSQPNKKTTD